MSKTGSLSFVGSMSPDTRANTKMFSTKDSQKTASHTTGGKLDLALTNSASIIVPRKPSILAKRSIISDQRKRHATVRHSPQTSQMSERSCHLTREARSPDPEPPNVTVIQ